MTVIVVIIELNKGRMMLKKMKVFFLTKLQTWIRFAVVGLLEKVCFVLHLTMNCLYFCVFDDVFRYLITEQYMAYRNVMLF